MQKIINNITALLLFLLAVTCTKEEALPVDADFDMDVVNNDFSVPVQVVIINKSVGADNYEWTFEGGQPANSFERHPGSVLFETPGTYTITLYATNRDDSEDTKEVQIKIDSPVLIDFEVEVVDNNYPPVEIKINNNTSGATQYTWSFEGGTPSMSNKEHPENVVFQDPGEYIIKLEVSNGLENYELEKKIIVEKHLNVDFDWEINFDDTDYQVPFTMNTINNSVSALSYEWAVDGPENQTLTGESPQIVLTTPGIYNISLIATNGKETKTASKSIEVFANTNLRVYEDVKFGINMSHNNNVLGSMFSTKTGNIYTRSEINESNGSEIDIVFFGLNSTFALNKFVSPDQTETTTFNSIPNAIHTKFINSQELCECTASLSVAEFDQMNNDNLLQTLTIEETEGGLLQFNNLMVPRIVLFEDAEGRKGAIKIKDFIEAGQNSYIVTDIKVQKETE